MGADSTFYSSFIFPRSRSTTSLSWNTTWARWSYLCSQDLTIHLWASVWSASLQRTLDQHTGPKKLASSNSSTYNAKACCYTLWPVSSFLLQHVQSSQSSVESLKQMRLLPSATSPSVSSSTCHTRSSWPLPTWHTHSSLEALFSLTIQS